MPYSIVQQMVATLIQRSPEYYERFDAVMESGFQNLVERQSPAVLDEYQESAIAAATSYLGASINSLRTLELLIIDRSTNPVSLKNLTTMGTAGITRQIVEPMIWSDWLLNSSTLEELRIRGYAAIWENASEANKYAEAIHAPDLASKREMFQVIIREGHNLGFIAVGKKKPIVKFPNATPQFASNAFPEQLIQGLQQHYGTNIQNAEWVYRWLSGLTHGMIWANTPQAPSQTQGIMKQVIGIDWNRLGLALYFANHMFESILYKYEHPVQLH